MDLKEATLDMRHCLRKEAEYFAKARVESDPKIKSDYETAAREYAYRAMLLKEIKKL